jgi:uncharacterized protein (DUF2147 family)
MAGLLPVPFRVLLLFFLSASATLARGEERTVYGVWATEKNHGLVSVEACGEAVCARVLDGDQIRANANQTDARNPDPAKRSRRVRGLYILMGYRGGPTHWAGGTVYDPQTGDESDDSTLDLLNDVTLKVRGCRFFLCRSETWTRSGGSVFDGRRLPHE